MKILLDPGHGYGSAHNRGSVVGNEGDNNFHYAIILQEKLLKKGFSVTMTRKTIYENPSLKQRGNLGKGQDLFLSLHSNAAAFSVRGTEIYGDVNANDPLLMKNLSFGIAKVMETVNRGVRYRVRSTGKIYIQEKSPGGSNWYGVLYHNQAKTGMLIEHVFHTNRIDCKNYVEKRKELAQCAADILAAHYKMTHTKEHQIKIIAHSMNIRSGPTTTYPVIKIAYQNDIFTITETKDNWGHIKEINGWINISPIYVTRI